MSTLGIPNTFTDDIDQEASGEEVNENFDAVKDAVNGGLGWDNTDTGADGLLEGSFSAWSGRGSGQAIGSSAWTLVEMGAVECNFGGWHDTTLDRFVPQAAGWYELTAFASFASTVGAGVKIGLELWKNGVAHKRLGLVPATGGIGAGVGGACQVVANGTTDYFELKAYQESGSNKDLFFEKEYLYFQGRFLGRV